MNILKIKSIIPSTIAQRITQCLRINVTKEGQALYTEKNKALLTQIKSDLSRWKDILYAILPQSDL